MEKDREMLRVSVIIPVFNNESYIAECLKSVIDQTYESVEIIVVDDCSADSSAHVVEEFAKNHTTINLVRQEKNRGVSAARNRGIEEAKGEYLLFLDADDAIVPTYIETLVEKQRETGAGLLGYRLVRVEDGDFEAVKQDMNADSTVAGTNARLFTEYTAENVRDAFFKVGADWDLSAIGGKLVSRKLVGDTRFREDMKYGEDTQFLHLLVKKITEGTAYVRGESRYYLYRIHDDNAIKRKYETADLSYNDIICAEAEKSFDEGEKSEAAFWLDLVCFQLESIYEKSPLKESGKYVCGKLREMKKLKSFKALSFVRRRHISLMGRWPGLASLIQRIAKAIGYRLKKLKALPRSKKDTAGILTFHCSDNYGAMLQAYALKKVMSEMHIKTDIINYSPFYMVGRHWFLPYIPQGSIRKSLRNLRSCFRLNRKIGFSTWRAQRRTMKRFRKETVCPQGTKKRWLWRLKVKKYGAYVLGSDQIWNPDLTNGLRKAYFGPHKGSKAVAYAASLGGSSLAEKHTPEFKKLLSRVDALSMREKSAVPYIGMCGKQAVTVCDPVFLVGPGDWHQIMKCPAQQDYILVYLTESSTVIETYLQRLSKETGKKIIRLSRIAGADASENVIYDVSAGPAEFLGYVRNASYVVTNSFHALAFSIIFKKRFAAAVHKQRAARILDLLDISGLSHRLLNDENAETFDIDASDDSELISKTLADMRHNGRSFLLTNLGEFFRK